MRQERLLPTTAQKGLCSNTDRLVLKMREIWREVNWVFNKMFGQFGNWRQPLNGNIYERALAFAKGSCELCCVKVEFLRILKIRFLEKAILIVLPNTYIIYLVSKSTFCQRKVQTNGHLTSISCLHWSCLYVFSAEGFIYLYFPFVYLK